MVVHVVGAMIIDLAGPSPTRRRRNCADQAHSLTEILSGGVEASTRPPSICLEPFEWPELALLDR
jgi:hypothetical protein